MSHDHRALLHGQLGFAAWEAAGHLLLRTGRRLVVPLFLLSGALLVVTGRANEQGVVEIGPGATRESGYGGALVDPALAPAGLAAALAVAVLSSGLVLSWWISLRLEPGPDDAGRHRWPLAGGLTYRDRWALTRAVSGLRLLRGADESARRRLDQWRPGLGTRLNWARRWVPRLCWFAVGVFMVLAWLKGLDTTFQWQT